MAECLCERFVPHVLIDVDVDVDVGRYIGYPNTTGMKRVDYRFTDELVDPLDTPQKFTETLIRIPRCFLCYTPAPDVPEVRRFFLSSSSSSSSSPPTHTSHLLSSIFLSGVSSSLS
jgi:hypothetical protein